MKTELKLATKVSLIAILTTAAVILLLSVILLMTTAARMIDNSTETALVQSESAAMSFANVLERQLVEDASNIAVRSMANHVFRMYTENNWADTDFVLMQEDDIIFNRTEYDPVRLMAAGELSESGDTNYITVKAGQQYLFLARQPAGVAGTGYTVYMIKNATGIYSEINWLIARFVLMGGCAVSICAFLLYLQLKKAFRPIISLQRQTQMIADGIYDKRVEVMHRDEIGSLAENINRMAEAVDKNIKDLTAMADQQKMLLASLTHEIKTPMTSVIGYSDTLLRTKISDEQKKQAALFISRECGRIERLTQKMMALIAAGNQFNIVLEEQSVRKLFKTVRESTEELLKRSGTLLVLECNAERFQMDLDLMIEMLLNLIDNAVHAGAKRIAITARNNVLKITDDGKGIPKTEIDKIMQPFYRVDGSRSRKSGGLGLGLAICKKIAEAHQAVMLFDSIEKKGTTVSIIFTD